MLAFRRTRGLWQADPLMVLKNVTHIARRHNMSPRGDI